MKYYKKQLRYNFFKWNGDVGWLVGIREIEIWFQTEMKKWLKLKYSNIKMVYYTYIHTYMKECMYVYTHVCLYVVCMYVYMQNIYL